MDGQCVHRGTNCRGDRPDSLCFKAWDKAISSIIALLFEIQSRFSYYTLCIGGGEAIPYTLPYIPCAYEAQAIHNILSYTLGAYEVQHIAHIGHGQHGRRHGCSAYFRIDSFAGMKGCLQYLSIDVNVWFVRRFLLVYSKLIMS